MFRLRLVLGPQSLQVLQAAILEAWRIRIGGREAEWNLVIQMLVLGCRVDGPEAGCQIPGDGSPDPERIFTGVDIGRQGSIDISNRTCSLARHGGVDMGFCSTWNVVMARTRELRLIQLACRDGADREVM